MTLFVDRIQPTTPNARGSSPPLPTSEPDERIEETDTLRGAYRDIDQARFVALLAHRPKSQNMSAAAVDLPVARAYQEELAVRANNQNAILAMDTGTGKTLISVIVLRSKLAAARMRVAHDHRMVRCLSTNSKFLSAVLKLVV